MRADWADFYEGMADRLNEYTPSQLYDSILSLGNREPFLSYMHFEDADLWHKRGHNLDPFTVMGIFNRGQTDEHRQEIAKVLADLFKLDEEPPACYHGVPHLDPRKSVYDGDAQMWALFHASLNGPDEGSFAAAWDAAKDVRGNGLGTLSIGLFWIRPYKFMALDRISSPYIHEICHLTSPEEKCSGREYVNFMGRLSTCLRAKGLNYPEVAFAAWQEEHPDETC